MFPWDSSTSTPGSRAAERVRSHTVVLVLLGPGGAPRAAGAVVSLVPVLLALSAGRVQECLAHPLGQPVAVGVLRPAAHVYQSVVVGWIVEQPQNVDRSLRPQVPPQRAEGEDVVQDHLRSGASVALKGLPQVGDLGLGMRGSAHGLERRRCPPAMVVQTVA